MNEYEQHDARRIGRVIRAARKFRGISQSKLSQELQITQATFSNIEIGQAAISGSLWYRLTQSLGLLPDHTFFEGIVDNFDNLDDPIETGFKIPKRYTHNAYSTLRASQPFFRFFESCCGEKALDAFMKEKLDIDPDVRYIYSLRLSVRFNCDLAAHLIRAGHLKSGNLSLITNALTDPKNHGKVAHYYKEARNPIDLMKTLIKYVSLYERNFSYSIINETSHSLDIASIPADFMRYFSYREDELPDFVNQYRLSFLKSFSSYLGHSKPLNIKLIPGSTKRKTECIFRITTC